MIGFVRGDFTDGNANPSLWPSGQSYRAMPYAFYCYNNGQMNVWENGVHKGAFGAYTSSSALEIRLHRDGERLAMQRGLHNFAMGSDGRLTRGTLGLLRGGQPAALAAEARHGKLRPTTILAVGPLRYGPCCLCLCRFDDARDCSQQAQPA